MSEAAGEHEPLIEAPVAERSAGMGGVSMQPNDKEARKPGPMAISRSTRYGILAGIWTATFLSVCTVSLLSSYLLTLWFSFCTVFE